MAADFSMLQLSLAQLQIPEIATVKPFAPGGATMNAPSIFRRLRERVRTVLGLTKCRYSLLALHGDC